MSLSSNGKVIVEQSLKDVLKAAIVEVLEERGDLLRDLLEEVIEEVALAHAIEEGESSELVGREQVFKMLEGEA